MIASYAHRQTRRGKLYWGMVIVSWIPALGWIIALYTMSQGTELIPAGLQDAEHRDRVRALFLGPADTFFGHQLLLATFLAALTACPLISEDLRRHALALYFSRPTTAFHYVLGKWLAVMSSMLRVFALPTLALCIVAFSLVPRGAEFGWPIAARLFAAEAYASAVCATVALGVSAIGRSSRYSVVLWFVVSFFTHLASGLLIVATQEPEFAFVSFRDDLQLVAARILDLPPEAGAVEGPSPWVAFAISMAWCAGAVVLLASRTRSAERT
ncbi:MAG TPA: ABC transporter permease subunit [Planctomycetota bacterium]|nr:ABC transporter permease subunit [Planctomycetota bacterium]